jgi:hypothetical protein
MDTALLVAELVGDAEHRPPKNRLAAWNEDQRTVRPEFSVLINVNVREAFSRIVPKRLGEWLA